ncbi:hypothetical protein M422DRAFT_785281 [Sphaerobolus stellatus SS14]|uniref:Uncharacterized protein n=1 Tax=Sphaerobolus stellatus (strain SS14) TaxID=990650 RepID=A0A0C9TB33_SPHS4|nr:hypothetical protein M422DRAFT_785281 [Sphaerobolus stellatus SS14]
MPIPTITAAQDHQRIATRTSGEVSPDLAAVSAEPSHATSTSSSSSTARASSSSHSTNQQPQATSSPQIPTFLSLPESHTAIVQRTSSADVTTRKLRAHHSMEHSSQISAEAFTSHQPVRGVQPAQKSLNPFTNVSRHRVIPEVSTPQISEPPATFSIVPPEKTILTEPTTSLEAPPSKGAIPKDIFKPSTTCSVRNLIDCDLLQSSSEPVTMTQVDAAVKALTTGELKSYKERRKGLLKEKRAEK